MANNELAEAVAEVLRVERARARIPHSELIDRSGISRSAMGRLLTGERAMSIPQLVAICRVFSIKPSAFMAMVEEAHDRHLRAQAADESA